MMSTLTPGMRTEAFRSAVFARSLRVSLSSRQLDVSRNVCYAATSGHVTVKTADFGSKEVGIYSSLYKYGNISSLESPTDIIAPHRNDFGRTRAAI